MSIKSRANREPNHCESLCLPIEKSETKDNGGLKKEDIYYVHTYIHVQRKKPKANRRRHRSILGPDGSLFSRSSKYNVQSTSTRTSFSALGMTNRLEPFAIHLSLFLDLTFPFTTHAFQSPSPPPLSNHRTM